MEKLKKFLIEAKKATYANENAKEFRVRGGGKILRYNKGNLLYQDRYYGANPFVGEEIIAKEGRVIWAMNYAGVTKKGADTKRIYDFLKKVLKRVTPENPFRGPRTCTENLFEYRSSTKGNLTFFSGSEEILYEGVQVYKGHYHGGLIK